MSALIEIFVKREKPFYTLNSSTTQQKKKLSEILVKMLLICKYSLWYEVLINQEVFFFRYGYIFELFAFIVLCYVVWKNKICFH